MLRRQREALRLSERCCEVEVSVEVVGMQRYEPTQGFYGALEVAVLGARGSKERHRVCRGGVDPQRLLQLGRRGDVPAQGHQSPRKTDARQSRNRVDLDRGGKLFGGALRTPHVRQNRTEGDPDLKGLGLPRRRDLKVRERFAEPAPAQ